LTFVEIDLVFCERVSTATDFVFLAQRPTGIGFDNLLFHIFEAAKGLMDDCSRYLYSLYT
jgi:hypothetical protein